MVNEEVKYMKEHYWDGLTKDEVIAGYTCDKKLPQVGDTVHFTEEMACGKVVKVHERSRWFDHGDDGDGLQRTKFEEDAVMVTVRSYKVKWCDGQVGDYLLGVLLQMKDYS